MNDDAERVQWLAVQHDVELHQGVGAVARDLVVHAGVAARGALQAVVKVQNHFRERQLVGHHHVVFGREIEAQLRSAALFAQRDRGTDVLRRHVHRELQDRFFDGLDVADRGHLRRVVDAHGFAVFRVRDVNHARSRGDQIQVVLAFEPLLDDFHVQKPEKAAAKAETERVRRVGLEAERRIVHVQLRQRIAQILVLGGVGREDAGEHHRLHFAKAGQGLGRAVVERRDGIADLRVFGGLDVRGDEADLTRTELVDRDRMRVVATHLGNVVVAPGGHELEAVALLERAVHHAQHDDRAAVAVVPAIEEQRAERCFRISLGRRHPSDHRLQHLEHADAGLATREQRPAAVEANHLLDLLGGVIDVRRRQVDLVQDRDDFQVIFDGQVGIGHRLCLHALRGIDHQERAFTGAQARADLVVEVHVSGRVDQLQLILFTADRDVLQAHRLRFDGDAAFTLQRQLVEELLHLLALTDRPGDIQDAVGKRAFAVIDVSDDREVTNLFWVGRHRAASARCSRGGRLSSAASARRPAKPRPGPRVSAYFLAVLGAGESVRLICPGSACS